MKKEESISLDIRVNGGIRTIYLTEKAIASYSREYDLAKAGGRFDRYCLMQIIEELEIALAKKADRSRRKRLITLNGENLLFRLKEDEIRTIEIRKYGKKNYFLSEDL